ncbi:MAG: LysR substrate-binding domain-containing protein [Pseudomonadota bacterium]
MKVQNPFGYVNLYIMVNFRKDLASFSNLITFEAASRSANFTRAAEALGVTRVSVSRQIAELEATLGTRLFYRHHRSATLTEAGKLLKSGVNPALLAIADTLRQVQGNPDIRRLSVTTTTAFSTYWLMPRLSGFGALFPEVELNLIVSDRYLDLDAEQIDVAIRYTDKPPAGKHVTELFRERLFPVFSPSYQLRTQLREPSDLLGEHLLHLSGTYRAEARWPHWFRQMGIEYSEQTSGALMNTYITMLQAAIEGQGIALAGSPLISQYITDGTLTTMQSVLAIDRDCFFLIERATGRQDSNDFCAWVKSQAAAEPPASTS